MKEWKIPVEWAVCSTVAIEAETLEEAVAIFDETIEDLALPTDPDYIDGSFKRNEDEEDTLEYYKLFN